MALTLLLLLLLLLLFPCMLPGPECCQEAVAGLALGVALLVGWRRPQGQA
jgi:hypothetical protein